MGMSRALALITGSLAALAAAVAVSFVPSVGGWLALATVTLGGLVLGSAYRAAVPLRVEATVFVPTGMAGSVMLYERVPAGAETTASRPPQFATSGR
jgi:hypothetical protein